MRLRRSAKATLQARFARLTRSQGPSVVRDQASATRLLEKAAEHSGVDLWKYVDEVQYGNFIDPSFSVQGAVRIIKIPNNISQSNKYMQLKIAGHELNHARCYQKLIERFGLEQGHARWIREGNNPRLYAREEVLVERVAALTIRSVFEGKLTGRDLRRLTEALNESKKYIDGYKAQM